MLHYFHQKLQFLLKVTIIKAAVQIFFVKVTFVQVRINVNPHSYLKYIPLNLGQGLTLYCSPEHIYYYQSKRTKTSGADFSINVNKSVLLIQFCLVSRTNELKPKMITEHDHFEIPLKRMVVLQPSFSQDWPQFIIQLYTQGSKCCILFLHVNNSPIPAHLSLICGES